MRTFGQRRRHSLDREQVGDATDCGRCAPALSSAPAAEHWALDRYIHRVEFGILRSPSIWEMTPVRTFTAVVERDPDTGLYVGYVPGFRGAHSQGETLDELNANLREVIAMLLEDGEPPLETEFVGTQTILGA